MAQDSSPFANPADAVVTAAAPAAVPSPWNRWEERLERCSEWLNPILVKEARQAFKSYQFLITFLLLLILGWGWSVLGVILQMPGVQFGAGGINLLMGYFLILVVPLLIIVPFSAFRSLAAEREDGTFEILSITTLSARQIVTGKLGSAVLQMLVYYSAISPCIAFTYLLRGVDVVLIGIILFYTFALSLLASTFSLMMATVTRSRVWQVMISMALLLILVLVAIAWGSAVVPGMLASQWVPPVHEVEFWPMQFALTTAIGGCCVLFVAVARGQISFASDNRAGPLRQIMLGHQVVFLGWVIWGLTMIEEPEYLAAMYAMAGFYWTVMGAFMVGESATLSPRVRRGLPKTLLGRMLFTWFNPGSGTGYMFAVTNLGAIWVTFMIGALVSASLGRDRFFQNTSWFWFCTLIWAYVVAYLGATRLLMLAVRFVARPNIFLSFLVCLLLAIAGCAIPFLTESALAGFAQIDYTPLQFTNWWWTLYMAGDRDIWLYPIVVPLVLGGAAIMLLLQLLTLGKELWEVREATPERVAEEDRLAQASVSPEMERSGPWD